MFTVQPLVSLSRHGTAHLACKAQIRKDILRINGRAVAGTVISANAIEEIAMLSPGATEFAHYAIET